jgi:hypothetical protein
MVPHTVEYVDGKKTRKPGQPVENYYPAIVEQETFASVTAMKLARSPMRGRHTEVSNVLGGLAKCPLCGGTMTRVSKGTGNGNAKLVCAKAKAGAGCRYRAVDYVQVEQALLENASWLVATAPAGSDTLDNEVVKAESGIEATRDEVARLLHEFGRGTSPTAAGLVRELEASIEEQQRHLEALYARQAATTGPFVGRRLAELDAALTSETLDRKAVNTLLRQLLTGATVDYLRGRVVVEWRHGGSSEVVFAWSEA